MTTELADAGGSDGAVASGPFDRVGARTRRRVCRTAASPNLRRPHRSVPWPPPGPLAPLGGGAGRRACGGRLGCGRPAQVVEGRGGRSVVRRRCVALSPDPSIDIAVLQAMRAGAGGRPGPSAVARLRASTPRTPGTPRSSRSPRRPSLPAGRRRPRPGRSRRSGPVARAASSIRCRPVTSSASRLTQKVRTRAPVSTTRPARGPSSAQAGPAGPASGHALPASSATTIASVRRGRTAASRCSAASPAPARRSRPGRGTRSRGGRAPRRSWRPGPGHRDPPRRR